MKKINVRMNLYEAKEWYRHKVADILKCSGEEMIEVAEQPVMILPEDNWIERYERAITEAEHEMRRARKFLERARKQLYEE